MSDDFHDAFEEGIRDNAGHLALAGAMMAHSQRKQQLQALEASRRHQAEIARTEAERLEVERQRLEIEKLRHQIEKDEKEAARLEKEAVRLLRVMMAEVGLALDSFMSRGELKGSPQGARRNYVMAVLMSKLALVRSRSGSLSDLNDLKELARLKELSEDLVAKHFPGGDPLEAARDKWRELQVWMDGVERLEKDVKQACAVVPDPTAVQLPSQADLVAMQAKLEAFAAQLPSKLSKHVHCLPAEAAVDGVVLSELTEQAQLEDLAAGKQANRSKAFASRWRQAATTRIAKEPGVLVTHEMQAGLLQQVHSAIEKLQQWQDKAADHEKMLQQLKVKLEEGQLKEAELSAKELGKVKFAGLNYDLLIEQMELERTCKFLVLAKRGAALKILSDLRKQHVHLAHQSELQKIMTWHQKRAEKEERNSLLLGIITLGLTTVYNKSKDRELFKRYIELKGSCRIVVEAIEKAEATKAAFLAMNDGDTITIAPNVLMPMAYIRPGSFTMGSPASEDGHESIEGQVEVILSQPFWLAKTAVTQAQWEVVMVSNPSTFKGANLPVENVSWENAQAFIDKLNDKQILPEGWKFALPTEAQWEYACRAGEKGPYSGGSLDEVGWYDRNSGSRTHEVAQKSPNAWGLYDMHGNVWEWCADWYENRLKAGTDPVGPSKGYDRVLRGGSWSRNASFCRSANRNGNSPGYRFNNLGFRPAIVPSR